MRGLVCTLVVAIAAPAHAESFVDWIRAHGASQNALDKYEYDADVCDEIAVGPKHEAAVQCSSTEDVSRPTPGSGDPAYRVVEHFLIRTVRAHDVITLIDVPVRSQALDAVPRFSNRKPWNPFVVARDGMSITVGDPSDASACRGAWRRGGATADERVWNELDGDLRARVCTARGTYVWRGERFRRRS